MHVPHNINSLCESFKNFRLYCLSMQSYLDSHLHRSVIFSKEKYSVNIMKYSSNNQSKLDYQGLKIKFIDGYFIQTFPSKHQNFLNIQQDFNFRICVFLSFINGNNHFFILKLVIIMSMNLKLGNFWSFFFLIFCSFIVNRKPFNKFSRVCSFTYTYIVFNQNFYLQLDTLTILINKLKTKKKDVECFKKKQ